MQVRCDEGVAIHIGPKPCVCAREGAGEASAGERIGQPLSRESQIIPGADVLIPTEGDMAERDNASVPTARGANQVDCVRACFGAFDRIDAQRSAYERDFGLVPDFRAGLHCGPVAVGELGYLKKEIALIGDTMNAAARIVEARRETENRVLASAALLDRLAALPPGVTRRRLGEIALRGKERPLELCALEADGDRARKRLARRETGDFSSPLSGRPVIERRLSRALRSFSRRPR